jgi:SAM-dependent methyltransferase
MRAFAATLKRGQSLKIGDVGADDVNGNYRALFTADQWEYSGIDMTKGDNVDIVVKDPYNWPNIKPRSFDVVVSGQVLEHVPMPWEWIKEVARIAKKAATICIIAPHTWHYHEFPVDCWRVWPDGMLALFEHAKIEPIRVYRNATDTVGIGVK